MQRQQEMLRSLIVVDGHGDGGRRPAGQTTMELAMKRRINYQRWLTAKLYMSSCIFVCNL
jgi:hypothetical protein